MSFIEMDIPGIRLARRYAEVSSTMDVARELIAEHAVDSAWTGLVLADQQLAGRGRQGRVWHSPGGALLATFIFCVEGGPSMLSGYSLACGVALYKALASIQACISLKWPNDLVVVGADGLKKLGGILIEVEPNRGFHCVLVGVGINVARPPQDLAGIATSVTDIRGIGTSAQEVLLPTSREFVHMHHRFVSQEGFGCFSQEWSSASCFRPGVTTIGIDTGLGEMTGTYEGIESSGALVLRVGGERRQFISGHITSLSM